MVEYLYMNLYIFVVGYQISSAQNVCIIVQKGREKRVITSQHTVQSGI